MAIEKVAEAAEPPAAAAPHGSSSDVDERTVFVRSLPFSLSDAQLEEIFSELGPVRHCFTVKEKGAEVHRGFGFVQFAVAEDALRAVESKNGVLLQGRKIKVELAKRRAPLDQRRPLANVKGQAQCTESPWVDGQGGKEPKSRKQQHEEGKSSDKQRPARTVVVGGIENPKMLASVIAKAKKLGSVEEVRHPLEDIELVSRGLAKDGCKQMAAAIVYVSVKEACHAVASLHQKMIGNGVLWARQLGGEGSKLKKWRLIVRNLPFQLKEQTLRALFSPAGFVWEITIPRKLDGSSKGFAFIGFTCKTDAEKAIKTVNGTVVSKRPIAVDWAVAKKTYETIVAANAPNAESERGHTKRIGKESNEGSDEGQEDDSVRSDAKSNESLSEDDENDTHAIDSAQERDLLKRVLNKVVVSGKDVLVNTTEVNNVDASDGQEKQQQQGEDKTVRKKKEARPSKLPEQQTAKEMSTDIATADFKELAMRRTVFIRNLPVDVNVLDMRRRFSAFGEVKSFRPVLHPITKRPKGTAFLEFATVEGADTAVAAANKIDNVNTGVLVVKGHQLAVNLALDRDQARNVAKQASIQQDDHDRRHLKLAKEGLIEEGTPAAQGVSKGDMAKRKQVEHEKATKLRSPNFHVSTTRLALHNLPKDLMEKDLKELVIKAVKSRASKQHPVVKQVKILRDEVKGMPSVGGRSRGAAFVEFTEHQHALVALRVLNNNPETFSSEHRPIVTFAIENSQILKKRAARNFQAKGGFPQKRTADRQTGNEREDGSEKSGRRKQEPRVEKHASEKEGESRNAIAGSEKQEGGERPGKQKRKREKKKKVPVKIGNGDLKTPILGEREVVAAATKRDRKRARKEHENGMLILPAYGNVKLQRQKGVQDQIPKAGKVGTQAVPEVSRRERKHPRAEDKLDQLVAEYRTKYFNPPVASNHNSTGKGSTKVAAGDLRRWFE
ncbi:unnamed protein product [Sphagnum jensenii]